MSVWAHHMFATGRVLLPFFSFLSYLIAVPIAYHCLAAYGIELTTPRVAIHSITGCVLYTRALWARALGIVLAVVSAVGNFMFLPYYPLWSMVVIAMVIASVEFGVVRAEPFTPLGTTEAVEVREFRMPFFAVPSVP